MEFQIHDRTRYLRGDGFSKKGFLSKAMRDTLLSAEINPGFLGWSLQSPLDDYDAVDKLDNVSFGANGFVDERRQLPNAGLTNTATVYCLWA